MRITKRKLTVPQRDGQSPDIHVTIRHYFLSSAKLSPKSDKPITKSLKRNKSKEPIDYGVTKAEFLSILDKASQPIKKPESDSEKAQT